MPAADFDAAGALFGCAALFSFSTFSRLAFSAFAAGAWPIGLVRAAPTIALEAETFSTNPFAGAFTVSRPTAPFSRTTSPPAACTASIAKSRLPGSSKRTVYSVSAAWPAVEAGAAPAAELPAAISDTVAATAITVLRVLT